MRQAVSPQHPLTMSLTDIILRVLAACVFGAVIGFEREMKHRPAGLRTNMLTALATCVFTLVTLKLARDIEAYGDKIQVDPLRMVQAIAQAAAFLAAGAIIHGRGHVRGLTTGASLWMSAAVGLACGAGYYGTAGIATA